MRHRAMSLALAVLASVTTPAASALTLSPGQGLEAGLRPAALAAGDVDRDGWVDVVAADEAGDTVAVLFGDGAGGFAWRATVPAARHPAALALADLDGDGALDVATAGGGGDIVLRFGDGHGAFPRHQTVTTSSNSISALTVADLNLDGRPDLVTDAPRGGVRVLLRQRSGDYERAPGSPYEAAGPPSALVAGEENGDGWPDVVAASAAAGTVAVLAGRGTGALALVSRHLTHLPPYALALADFNADGALDAALGEEGGVEVVRGDGRGDLESATILEASEVRGLATLDADDDGLPDLVATGGNGLLVGLVSSDLGLRHATGSPVALGGATWGVVAFDADGDGLEDAVVSRPAAGDVVVVRNASEHALAASPPAVDFGVVEAGTSTGRSVTVAGDGLATRVTAVGLEGDPDLALEADTCTGVTLGDGRAGCRIDVRFRPAAPGERVATLVVEGERAWLEVPLRGQGADTTPPDTSITAHPTDPTTEREPIFSFASDDPEASFECRMDGDGFSACNSPYRSAPLTEGPHTFEVRATDASGNTDPTPASFTFTVVSTDADPPETTIIEHPAPVTNDLTPTFRFISDEPGSTFSCSVDYTPPFGCTPPVETDVLAEGPHRFAVAAIDPSGNADPTPDAFAFTVDTTRPKTIIEGPSRPTSRRALYTFRFSEDVSEVRCSIDGSGYSFCKTPYNARALRPGRHVLRVLATDVAGNVEAKPATKRFTIVRP